MLKKFAVLLMLVLAPLAQARAVYFCSMMGGEVATECCCGDAHERMRHDGAATDACCTVSIEPGRAEFAAAASTLSIPQSLSAQGSDAPPAVVDSWAGLRLPAFAIDASAPAREVVRPLTRSLYLLTARLRL